MSSPEAIELAQAMRELWPHGWRQIDDGTVAAALDKFAAERAMAERRELIPLRVAMQKESEAIGYDRGYAQCMKEWQTSR